MTDIEDLAHRAANMPYKECYDSMTSIPVDLYIEYRYNRNSEDIDKCHVTIGESDIDVWDTLTEQLQGAITEAIIEDYERRDL